MGFLSSAEVIECSASDLVGQYIGQTGPKTKALLEKALGRVLFIDEAYRLGDGPFAKEAIDELVSMLTQPRFLNKIIVVLAGYDNDMNKLLSINSGLSSRFSEELIFRNMSPLHCLQVLRTKLAEKQVRLLALDHPDSAEYQSVVKLLEQLAALPSWGNARDVGTLAKQMISHVYTSPLDETADNGELLLSAKDAIACMSAMLDSRKERSRNVPSTSPLDVLRDHFAMVQERDPPAATGRAPPATKAAPPKMDERREQARTPAIASDDQRDAGVTDSVWHKLQRDKLAAEIAEQQEQERIERLEREIEENRIREEAEQARMAQIAAQRARDAAAEAERMRQLEAARLKVLEARKKREREEAALRAAREEEEKRRAQEAKAQAALRQMGVCVAGYRWIKQASGYRCAGGSHFVGNEALGI